jgi:hypothetical protein
MDSTFPAGKMQLVVARSYDVDCIKTAVAVNRQFDDLLP